MNGNGDDPREGGGEADEETAPNLANLTTVSRRLLIVTVIMLVVTVGMFGITLFRVTGRFPISWFCFGVGVLGGFVSIQQRLGRLSKTELTHLADSWVHIFIFPFFGGIFALVFYLLTLSGLLEGALFPAFSIPEFSEPATTADLVNFFQETYPSSGQDFAKLGVWSFISGFSERFLLDTLAGTILRTKI